MSFIRLAIGLLVLGVAGVVATRPDEPAPTRPAVKVPDIVESPAPAPSIRFFTQQIVEVQPRDVPFMMYGVTDHVTVGSGVVVLDFIPHSITAPNTYRDGDHCYSGNVLHVDGTRIPVTCPEEQP